MPDTRSYPLCLFANFVNELMVRVPDERHTRALVSVSPRKIWLAQPGDVLVLPTEPPADFWAYAHGVLGLFPGDVEVLAVDTTVLRPLATRVRELGLTDRLHAMVTQRPGIRAMPFALDRPAVEFLTELGLPIDGYDTVPLSALESAYALNTKSGFHRRAAEVGIPTVPGVVCGDRGELRAAVAALLGRGIGAVVKLDRSSNGFGLLFVRPEQAGELDRILDGHLSTLSGQPAGWLVEELMPVDQVLTVEMWSAAGGPQLVHIGQMNTPNGSFSGQLTPPPQHTPQLDELAAHGMAWGARLHADGYRGPFDLDAITARGRLYITETNVRRTGTTYLEYLVRRLVPDGDPVWLADSRVGASGLDFAAAVEALESAGIAYSGGTGVVLTADTRAVDRRWRFLILGHDHAQVSELEKRLADVLGLD
ncbi:peptide ligase PGM1-related protein [Allorhizocola rhizosphaerae]|uniref:preATP grasp domain-containing protein n=1 Tax=Allorhizocola rhizosphaerae TaxID=1872709 RepID=UPI0013C331E5|nr:peptide ligase PGM1-related protein [Allorhizocola rhizosphaerae]